MQRKFPILSALFGLGLYSISTQIFLIREFLSLFSGNELVLGLVLGSWLLLTGLGAFLGNSITTLKNHRIFVQFLLLLIAAIPMVAVYKLDMLRPALSPYGSIVGLWSITRATLMIQLPFCLINGYLFTALTSLLADEEPAGSPGRAYTAESLGSLVAGVLVNFVLLWVLPVFDNLRILLALFGITVILFSLSFRKWYVSVVVAILLGGMVQVFYKIPFNKFVNNALYREQLVVLDQDTPYGRVVVTQSSGQDNYYENGKFLFSSGNVIWNEEAVHYAMLQHPHIHSVLLISGGISGTIPEILKYNPRIIDYLEMNPALAKIALKSLSTGERMWVKVRQQDARLFLRHSQQTYDVILVNEPEPATLQMNRYYTLEFFRLLKSHLNPGGVISSSLPTTSDYVSPGAQQMNSSLFNTLSSLFAHVVIIPGTRNWFLASDSALTTRIAALASTYMPDNVYVGKYYLDDDQLRERSDYLRSNISADAPLNLDLHPVIYRQHVDFWLSYFKTDIRLLVGLVIVLAILLIVLLHPVRSGLFSGGFSSASLEIIVLLAFQVAFGYVFQMAGVVIIVFMLGLSIGPWFARKLIPAPDSRHFLVLVILMAATSVVTMMALTAISPGVLAPWLLYAILFTITLATSVLTGMEYAVASVLTSGGPVVSTSRNYAADLLGSALGAFLVTLFLIPVLGMFATLGLLAGLNLLSVLMFLIKRSHL